MTKGSVPQWNGTQVPAATSGDPTCRSAIVRAPGTAPPPTGEPAVELPEEVQVEGAKLTEDAGEKPPAGTDEASEEEK